MPRILNFWGFESINRNILINVPKNDLLSFSGVLTILRRLQKYDPMLSQVYVTAHF